MISEILKHVDFERANVLLEGFNKSTGFVTAILDLEGNILSQSGWRRICSDFHRKNPKTASNCFESDTFLANKLKADEKYLFYKCMNGLIDVRLPIVIRGEHIANLFSGQFFFEKPDVSFFRNQAIIHGFDEKEYLEALSQVPVIPKQKVQIAMDFLLNITQLIIEMTADRIEQIEINEAIKRNGVALSENQKLLKKNVKDLLESQRIAHLGTWRLDLVTNEVVWSEELYKMYGFDPTFPVPPYTEHMKLFTSQSWNRLSTSLEKTRTTGIPYELELETVTKDGSNGWMWVRGEAEKDSEGNIIALWGAAQDITAYKRIELETKQSEERFQLLFNKAPIGYQSLDFDGYFIEVNQQWLSTLGYSKEEVIGKWFGDFLCPEYVEGFRKRFPLFKSQGYIHSEFEMMTKGGNRLYMAFEGKIGYDTDGKFKQTHCVLQDITNQRKAEKALIESEERYKYLFENSGVGVGYYTVEGKIISYNKKALEYIGGRLEDYVGKSIRDIFPKEDADEFLYRIEIAVLSDQSQQYEDSMATSTGLKWFSSTITKVTNIVGEIIGIQIASLDITERKKTEHELGRIMAQNQRILDNLQDSYFQADLEGKFTVVNPQAATMYGYLSASELIGQSAALLYADPQDRKRVIEELKKVGEVTDMVFRGCRKNGETFWVSMNVQFVKDEQGTILGTEGLVRDISERITMQNEIELQRDNLIASNEKLAHLLEQSVNSISKIGELRDTYTAGHQRRVKDLSCAIAKELGLSNEAITNLAYGALIHDIGKINVPTEILNKPGRISNIEFQIIQTHVEHGYNIAKGIDFPEAISIMVHQHHERLDGSGYPLGLSGDQIIMESRILAVSDVVEAMTSHRPYRPALGIDAALEEILNFRGLKYDDMVVDTCIELIRDKGFEFSDSIADGIEH
ncbi:MAG: PAS domain S-box protein [Erysipelotrichaceae bacterium]|nr:PAS domain S-box protein [Erysipelotrichaceae bacterium]